jgi:hypothetical protein
MSGAVARKIIGQIVINGYLLFDSYTPLERIHILFIRTPCQ